MDRYNDVSSRGETTCGYHVLFGRYLACFHFHAVVNDFPSNDQINSGLSINHQALRIEYTGPQWPVERMCCTPHPLQTHSSPFTNNYCSKNKCGHYFCHQAREDPGCLEPIPEMLAKCLWLSLIWKLYRLPFLHNVLLLPFLCGQGYILAASHSDCFKCTGSQKSWVFWGPRGVLYAWVPGGSQHYLIH